MLIIACILLSIGLNAQPNVIKPGKDRIHTPVWVSEKGYWVIESNIHSRYRHTVFFYNNDNILMYKETLDGIKLNAERRRIKMRLKKALETAALTWSSPGNARGTIPPDQLIVMTALR